MATQTGLVPNNFSLEKVGATIALALVIQMPIMSWGSAIIAW
jgi:hypothetical protein